MWPCRQRCRLTRSREGWERGREERTALSVFHRSSERSQPCLSADPSASLPRSATCALRCTSWPPASRRPPIRSSLARRPTDNAWKNPAPSSPSCRKPPNPRADDTFRGPRRRSWRTSCTAGSLQAPVPACRTGPGGARVSIRPGHPEGRAQR